MKRTVVRSFSLSEEEIKQAICCWLDSKHLPSPQDPMHEDVCWNFNYSDLSMNLQWEEQDEAW